jgi:large subunit ribosomal protein L25
MEKLDLEVQKRTGVINTSSAKVLRFKGQIPGIVYGRGMQPLPISVDALKFKKALSTEAGDNVIIMLNVSDGDKVTSYPVITKDLQIDPLTDKLVHVDLYHIDLEVAIETSVPVILVGEATGVKSDGGILLHGMREIKVSCLPLNIPAGFEVDVTPLKIGDSRHVSDLAQVEGVKILSPMEEMIATVTPPAKEEEVVAPVATVEATAAATPAGAVPEEGKKEPAPAAEVKK